MPETLQNLTVNQAMLDPEKDEILYIETSPDGTPHRAITVHNDYDFNPVENNGMNYYHASGSGLHKNTMDVGQLVDTTDKCIIWHHPSIKLVDHEGKELEEYDLSRRGYRTVKELPNPFDDACEGKTRYCCVTKQNWTDDQPSPYMVYMEKIGDFGGTGAGDDYYGRENSREHLTEFVRFLGPKKADLLQNMLGKIHGEWQIQIENSRNEFEYEIQLGHWNNFPLEDQIKIDLKNEKNVIEFEPAFAWLTTLDSEKTRDDITETSRIIHEVIFVHEKLKELEAKHPITNVGRKHLWKEIKDVAFHSPRKYWIPLAEGFQKSLSAI